MNDKLKQILNLLWTFESLKEEHILKMCDCTKKDINYLITRKAISKDKETNIIKYGRKDINVKHVAAFDVIMYYLNRNPTIKKGNHPVTISMTIKDGTTYDIIYIKEIEAEALFKKIDEVSDADKLIIIIEAKKYTPQVSNTKKPCYICIYPPIDIKSSLNWEDKE